jgi:DivIVA domain-containing protein
MGAKEIMSKKFEMVLRGYKTEEVEEFLKDVSIDFSQLQKENEDLEKKLTVLADKIREYREDEDTLKDALLGAQRQGNALIADSKRKAAEIIEDTQSKSDAMLKKAEEDRQKLNEKGESEIKAAQEKAAEIIDNANKKAKEIENEMNLKTNVQKEILHRTSTEIAEFKARVVKSYKEQIDMVEKIASKCENEFIKKTLKEGKPNLKAQPQQQSQQVKAQQQPKKAQLEAKSRKQQSKETKEPKELKEIEVEIEDKGSVTTEMEALIKIEEMSDTSVTEFEIDVEAVDPLSLSDTPVSEVEAVSQHTGEIHNTSDLFYKNPKNHAKNKGGRSKQLQFGGNNTEE